MQGPESHPIIKYRPDVDGLRAVAVLLVLADHLQIKALGGFVGVDVFFVISGYLISATILKEMNEGRFSIVAFYERRVRRIFPALLVMLAVVTALTWWFLVPAEMVGYARSMLAALASGSNFLFWHEGGYFDLPSDMKPLLHTWSLGVEEQFYILFPVFLVVVRRWAPKWMKAGILTVAAVSFAAACWEVRRDSTAAFFFAPLRAWELLMGTIVSQRWLPAMKSAWTRNVAAAVGVVLIVWPAFRYDDAMVFPGLSALPPCLGAALIIAAGERGTSLVGRGLATRPMTFLGLISYSLYLWHWPIIVLQKAGGLLVHDADLTHKVKLVAAAVSIVVGALSWKFVEQPFRKGRWRPGRRAVFAINGAALAALALVGFGMVEAHGFPARFPVDAQKVAAYVDYGERQAGGGRMCFTGPGQTFKDYEVDKCLAEKPGMESILLAGDSHAAHLGSGLDAVYGDRNVMVATSANCPPLTESVGRTTPNCRAMFDFLYDDFLRKHKVGTLLLSARWRETDLAELTRTLAFLRNLGVHVVLVGPGIEYDGAEPRIVAFALKNGHPEKIGEHVRPEYRELDAQMKEIARTTWEVPYISVFDDLCRPECPVYAGPDVPFLFDNSHMTAEGSVMLMKAVRASGQLP